MKAIAYQVLSDSAEGGSIAFDGPQHLIADNEAEFGIDTSILSPCWNLDLKPLVDKGDGAMGRMVSVADGELFLETLVRFRFNGYSGFVELAGEEQSNPNRLPPAK